MVTIDAFVTVVIMIIVVVIAKRDHFMRDNRGLKYSLCFGLSKP